MAFDPGMLPAMSANAQPDPGALHTAEEVLRAIYGDDFRGCTVSLETIAEIIAAAPKPQPVRNQEVFELYEKLVEAIHLLSTPPDPTKVTDPTQLRTLLGERLDTIHVLTTKTMKTTASAKARPE